MPVDDFGKTLLRRLSDHRFHSGTELAELLGVSRTAVWKRIRELEALGLEVSALPGKGYRLLSPLELLDEAAIRESLNPEASMLLASLELHDEIDSTNSHLMRAAAAGAPTGTVCLAETQTAGRGRVGRDWISPFGANIYLSVLWRFEDPSRVAGLSLAVGVAVVRALAAMGLREVGLKWPNDLLWGESKLGGILLEVAGEAHGPCRVAIGVGLNRYISSSLGRTIDQAWTDLVRVAEGAVPPRNGLAAGLLNELLPMLGDYEDQGLAPYLPEWRRFHRLQGREAVIHQGEASIRGRIEDVTAEGLLVLQCEDGSRRRFASGDVRLRTVAD
jgi:BirA family biotin operon repressor/biotin-[acetyl-CoA-carboxylase] ligase